MWRTVTTILGGGSAIDTRCREQESENYGGGDTREIDAETSKELEVLPWVGEK